MQRHLTLPVGMAILALASAGCKKSTTYSSKEGSVTVEQKGPDTTSATFTGKDGQTVSVNTGGGAIPGDYPKDLPVYPGAKVMMAQSASEKNVKSLMLESSDPAARIAEFYKNGLNENGWKIENTMTMGEVNMFTAVKDNRQAVVQIMSGPDKRTISQVLSDK